MQVKWVEPTVGYRLFKANSKGTKIPSMAIVKRDFIVDFEQLFTLYKQDFK